MHIIDKILDEEKVPNEAPPTTLSRQEVIRGAIVGPGAFPINCPVGGSAYDQDSESTEEPPSIVYDEEQPSPCYLAEASVVTEGRSRGEIPQNSTAVMEVYEGTVVVPPSTNKVNIDDEAVNVKSRPFSRSRRQTVALALIVVAVTSVIAGGATYAALSLSHGALTHSASISSNDDLPPSNRPGQNQHNESERPAGGECEQGDCKPPGRN